MENRSSRVVRPIRRRGFLRGAKQLRQGRVGRFDHADVPRWRRLVPHLHRPEVGAFGRAGASARGRGRLPRRIAALDVPADVAGR
eukprot:5621655-Pyramimonas_sp.AAC.1